MLSLEDAVLLIKDVSETIKNEQKKGGFLDRLLGTLGARLLGYLLTVKGVKARIPGKEVIKSGEGTTRAGEGTIRTWQDF